MQRTTLIVVGILFLIGAYYFIVENKIIKKFEDDKALSNRILKVKRGSLKTLEIIRGTETITCEKLDSGWMIKYPLQTKADDNILNSMEGTLSDIYVEDVIDGNLADFGLSNPRLKINLYLTDKPTAQTLLMGDFTQAVDNIYCYRWSSGKGLKNQDKVVTVAKFSYNELNRQFNDLRDKNIFNFAITDIQKCVLKKGSNEIAFEHDLSDNWWGIIGRDRIKLQKGKVQDFLLQSKELKVKEFVDNQGNDLSKYGLSKPVIELSIWHGKNAVLNKVSLGKDKGVDSVYARREGFPEVFVIDKQFVNNLPTDIKSWEDKTLFNFSIDDIDRIELKVPRTDEIVMVKKKNKWEMIKPKGREFKAETVLQSLREGQYQNIVDMQPQTLKQYGLDKPSYSFVLWKKDEKIVNFTVSAKQNGKYYLKREGEGHILEIYPEWIEQIEAILQ